MIKKMLALLLATAMVSAGTVAFAGDAVGNVSTYKQSSNKKTIPSGSAAFFLQLEGLQMDSNGDITGRPSTYFTGIVATAKLKDINLPSNYAIALGNGVTESDILSNVINPPADDTAFDSAREQLQYKGYIRSNKGEVVPWAKLTSKNYEIDWYVFKRENDGWHIDGRIIDLATKDIIDIVIPDDPKDIPPEAYDKDEDTSSDDDTEDTSIVLKGATYAYIFGYEPVISSQTDENGNNKVFADVYMGMDDAVTTEQVSAMLMRLLDQENHTKGVAYKATPSVLPYIDAWFARGLAYEVSVGGLPAEGSIGLGKVTRAKVANLVSHALKLNKSKNTPFTDIAGNKYEDEIKRVYAYGYMKGVDDETFAPNEIMTRAEFCQLFNNIIGRDKMGLTALDASGNEYQITAEDYSFVDMSPKHWAYNVCLKATSAYDNDGYVSISKRQENIRNKVDDYDSQLLY